MPEELTIEKINKALKSAGFPVLVEKRGKKINLRATLPPKPKSDKERPHQQRIPLSCRDTPQGLKRTKSEAFALGANLEAGRFSWDDYLDNNPETLTVERAIAQFEEFYYQARGDSSKVQTTYRKDYKTAFNKLPLDEKLTKELLINTIKEKTKPATKSRRRTCIAYNCLAREVLGVELETKRLQGGYVSGRIDPDLLPNDELIESLYSKFTNYPEWQGAYCLLALYGLRPSEVFLIDPNSLSDPKGVIYVKDGKTEDRLVYPSRLDWLEKWNLPTLILPQSNARNNSLKGNRIAKNFRVFEIPFIPYMLRHAYAVRLASYGVNPSIVSKWMGHSLETHFRIYQRFISREHFDREFDRSIGSRSFNLDTLEES